jgi:peptidyl-prolyl cis-trans isomerase C
MFSTHFPNGRGAARAVAAAVLALGLVGGAASLAAAQTAGDAAAPAAQPAKVAPDTVVARVNGAPITEREVDTALDDVGQSFAGMSEAQRREAVITLLVDVKLAAAAAKKENLDQTPEFRQQLAFMREKALMQAFLDKAAAGAVTDKAVQQVYDETVKATPPEEEVRAAHILVKTKDEAEKVEQRLKKGEDFAKVAKEVSKDPGSAPDGGELGFFTKDQMVPEFAKVAFAQKDGQVSQPVKTQFGWHIIKTEEKRTKPLPTLDQVRSQIGEYLKRRAQQEAVENLRKGAKIETTAAATPGDTAPQASGEAPAKTPAAGQQAAPTPGK